MVRAGVDVRPQDNGGALHDMQRGEQRFHLLIFAAVLGGGRVKDDQQERVRDVDVGAAAAGVDHLRRKRAVETARDIATGAADGENSVRPFAHALQVGGRARCAGKVIVGELADCMPSAFINGPGDFPTLDMGNAEIHIRRSQGCGQGFIAVADEQHQVRLETLKFAGKFHHAKAD